MAHVGGFLFSYCFYILSFLTNETSTFMFLDFLFLKYFLVIFWVLKNYEYNIVGGIRIIRVCQALVVKLLHINSLLTVNQNLE